MSRSVPSSFTGPSIVGALATVSVTTAALWWWSSRQRTSSSRRKAIETKNTLPNLEYAHPKLPLSIRLIARLPQSLRRPLLVAIQKPAPPLDGVDLVGSDYDPYEEMRALVPDKIWRVRYKFVADTQIHDALKNFYGIDLEDPSLLDAVPAANRSHLETCQHCMAAWQRELAGLDQRHQQLRHVQVGYETTQDMLVARVQSGENEQDAGGLLLYNPCRLHPKVLAWLESLGLPVRYIVSGSSSHTNQLPQAAAAFPNAKIICSQAADLKCQAAGMRAADFVYTDHDDDSPKKQGYQAAARELERLGVRLFYVQGDVVTQSLLVIAHGHLFDCDLTSYGGGKRWLYLDPKDWDDKTHPTTDENGSKPNWFTWVQLFYYAAMHRSCVPGFLPDYRVMGMDPTSLIIKLQLDEPDDSSRQQMAKSLRQLLKLESFSYVDNVHSRKRHPLSASEFKQCVDSMWSWLDGDNLL